MREPVIIDFLAREVRQSTLNRRRFLKATSYAALTSVLPSCSKFSTKASTPKNVAIIGGGLAGLSCAYELSKSGISCEVFEASSRLGGRAYTRTHFQEGMPVELGGEFIDSTHTPLLHLCTQLGVKLIDIRPKRLGPNSDSFFFKGKAYTSVDFQKAIKPFIPQILEDLDTLKTGGPQVTASFDQMSLDDYLAKLSKISDSSNLWVLQALAQAYTLWYGQDPKLQPALNMLWVLTIDEKNGEAKVFGESDEAFIFKKGSIDFVTKLKNKIWQKNPIHFNAPLIFIEKDNEQIKLTFKKGQQSFVKKSSLVVLAIPFSTLRDVDGLDSLGLPSNKLAAIKNIQYGHCYKNILGFNSRPWQKQTPYAPPTFWSMYSQNQFQCFYDMSVGRQGAGGILAHFTGGEEAKARPTSDRAQQLVKSLARYYPRALDEFNKRSISFHWPSYRYAKGAYMGPASGQIGKFSSIMGSTELGGRLYFAGEHTSRDNNGTMNGAVETGLEVAGQIKGS